MPQDVPWKLLSTDQQRTAQQAYGDFQSHDYLLTWHCDRRGVPFATWQFEDFICAAYWRCLDKKSLRLYPYTLGYALYGAEYPIFHYNEGKAGVPTKDAPNFHKAARMCARVRNWLRTTILQPGGQVGGPTWVPGENAWQFSQRDHFKVYIRYPPIEEVRSLPTEIVGDKMEDPDVQDNPILGNGVAAADTHGAVG
ncbi:unnamed protein product [Closterium sp. Naga37s-1]|nr:unnamed protein product [Closterium sp. Naga37s-1]